MEVMLMRSRGDIHSTPGVLAGRRKVNSSLELLQIYKEKGIGFPWFRKKIHRFVCRGNKKNRIFA